MLGSMLGCLCVHTSNLTVWYAYVATHVLTGLLITDTLGPAILSTVERLPTLKNVWINIREQYILFPLKGVLCREVIPTASVIPRVLYSEFPLTRITCNTDIIQYDGMSIHHVYSVYMLCSVPHCPP